VIEENLERMQAENVFAQVHDATVADETYFEQADVVIMDVPCSGLGVMGKKRDIKYHVTQESLQEIVKLQKQIVEQSWRYVKPGGILLYSTCTINSAENEDMVQWITEKFPFEPESLESVMPESLLQDKRTVQKLMHAQSNHKQAEDTQRDKVSVQEACIQLLPGYMEADGFFFARLRRQK